MTELDQIWSQMLADAATRAVDSGRGEIAEYLRLKAANDAIRAEGVKWLFDALDDIVAGESSHHTGLKVERTHPYKFAHGNSKMAGSLVSIRHGVRCLSLEAGWTRTPGDGIMLRGSLAAAKITHFGLPRNNANLTLAYTGALPLWHTEDSEGARTPFRITDLYHHFQTFVGV